MKNVMFLFCFSSRSSRGAGSENIYAFGREACLKTQLMSVGCCPHLPHLLSSTSQQPTPSSLPTRTLSQPFCWAPVRNLRVDKSHKVCTASYPDPPPACSCCCCPAPPPRPSPCPLPLSFLYLYLQQLSVCSTNKQLRHGCCSHSARISIKTIFRVRH